MPTSPKVAPIELTREECEKLLYALDTQKKVYERAERAETDAVIKRARLAQRDELLSIQAKIRNLSLSLA